MIISDKPLRLTCPYCGGVKHILTILSGNSFGAKCWSDGRQYYPMLQVPSPYQKCPHCGHYYSCDDAKPMRVQMQTPDPLDAIFEKTIGSLIEGDYTPPVRPKVDPAVKAREDQWREEAKENGFGELLFSELAEAGEDILPRCTTVEQKEAYYLAYIHAYNDGWTMRLGDGFVIFFDDDHLRFKEYAEEMAVVRGEPRTINAEMCRELGQFDRSIKICHQLLDKGIDVEVVRQILAHAEAKDSDVFELQFDENGFV